MGDVDRSTGIGLEEFRFRLRFHRLTSQASLISSAESAKSCTAIENRREGFHRRSVCYAVLCVGARERDTGFEMMSHWRSVSGWFYFR